LGEKPWESSTVVVEGGDVARHRRIVVPEVPHHVVARGVNRRRLFESGYEKLKYMKRFRLTAEELGVIRGRTDPEDPITLSSCTEVALRSDNFCPPVLKSR
jgi:hypothetical protein